MWTWEKEEELKRLRKMESEIGAALPSGAFYLDPPDGGDVSFAEQVRRIVAHVGELQDQNLVLSKENNDLKAKIQDIKDSVYSTLI